MSIGKPRLIGKIIHNKMFPTMGALKFERRAFTTSWRNLKRIL
jgi:hypothetical protein